MNLYLIYQEVTRSYDTYDSAVVAAETEETARQTHPSGEQCNWGERYGDWCDLPAQVTAELIGVATEGTPAGVVLASFNAG